MEFINPLSSDISDIREAISGIWGTEIGNEYKISYLGKLIIANGNKEIIENKLKKPVYELIEIGNNVYIGWIKNKGE